MSANSKVRLGVNLDHVMTIRQARFTPYPDLKQAIELSEKAGADGITMHLREDRRHIQDDDVYLAKQVIQSSMNLEMAATDEMRDIALKVKPENCCIVPLACSRPSGSTPERPPTSGSKPGSRRSRGSTSRLGIRPLQYASSRANLTPTAPIRA